MFGDTPTRPTSEGNTNLHAPITPITQNISHHDESPMSLLCKIPYQSFIFDLDKSLLNLSRDAFIETHLDKIDADL